VAVCCTVFDSLHICRIVCDRLLVNGDGLLLLQCRFVSNKRSVDDLLIFVLYAL